MRTYSPPLDQQTKQGHEALKHRRWMFRLQSKWLTRNGYRHRLRGGNAGLRASGAHSSPSQ
jgi:hypothetical protein